MSNEKQVRTFKATRLFPKATIKDAFELIKKIKEHGKDGKIENTTLAKLLSTKPGSVKYRTQISAAVSYKLVEGSGSSQDVSLLGLAKTIVLPTEAFQEKQGLIKAFFNIELFNSLHSDYIGKEIPKDEIFLNILQTRFKIPQNATHKCREIFLENCEYLELSEKIKDGIFIKQYTTEDDIPTLEEEKEKPEEKPEEKPNIPQKKEISKDISFNINIQIHIAADAGEKQIETIFASMSKHLGIKDTDK